VLLRVSIAKESVARESPKLLPRAIAHFVNFIEGRRKFGNGFYNGFNGLTSGGKPDSTKYYQSWTKAQSETGFFT
jgi:hypothetical protein